MRRRAAPKWSRRRECMADARRRGEAMANGGAWAALVLDGVGSDGECSCSMGGEQRAMLRRWREERVAA
jgi:hypothetical protein